MEHKRIPGLVDVIKVDQPEGILQVARDGMVDRAFGAGKPLLNSLLVRRILGVLSYNGRRFPTMSARKAPGREIRQDALWEKLNAAAPDVRAAPADLEPLAAWVRGSNTDAAVGPLVQQVIGRLFNPTFEGGEHTWAAAQVIAASLAPGNALHNLRWKMRQRKFNNRWLRSIAGSRKRRRSDGPISRQSSRLALIFCHKYWNI